MQIPSTLIAFARPEESSPLRAHLRSYPQPEVKILHVGIGAALVQNTLLHHLADAPRRVIIAGFGGALDPSLPMGACIRMDASDPVSILTVPAPVELAREKARLFLETSARIVDMETSAVVALCEARGIPWCGLRVVLDTAGEDLPVPCAAWYDLERQHPRPLYLLGWLLRHPGRIRPFITLMRRIRPASRALTVAVLAELERGVRD